MKKIFSALVAAATILSLAACGQAPQQSETSVQSQAAQPPQYTQSTLQSQAAQSSNSEESQSSSEGEKPAEPVVSKAAEPEGNSGQGGKTLVAYFSASGNTKAVAEAIAQTVGADLYELVPEQPYTDADLNWNDPASRVNAEHEDSSFRTAIAGGVKDLSAYDTVFIGYPLWWREAPSIVWNFVESSDLEGKTMIPFCTSMSDGFGSSGDTLAAMAPGANWLAGQRFGESLDAAAVAQWVNGLGLTAAAAASSAQAEQRPRALVAYFSMPETADPNNMTQDEEQSTVVIDGKVLGNTQYMATVIQEATGADIFRIEPATPYPTDHDTLVDLASQEQGENARPAIAAKVDGMDGYNVIYLGYPNWWGDMPMILYTFLEQYDLSGKTIVPFNTHGGSGFSGTVGTIQELEPNATVLDGLSISRNSIQDARQEIIDWVNSLKIAA